MKKKSSSANLTCTLTPCFACQKRSVDCHGSCSLYLDWRRMATEKAKKEKLQRQIDFELARKEYKKKRLY